MSVNSSSNIGFCFGALLFSSEYCGKSDSERHFGHKALTAVRQLLPDISQIAHSSRFPVTQLILLLLCDFCHERRAVCSDFDSLDCPTPLPRPLRLSENFQSAVRCHKMRCLSGEPPSTCRSGCALNSSPTARFRARRCAGQRSAPAWPRS